MGIGIFRLPLAKHVIAATPPGENRSAGVPILHFAQIGYRGVGYPKRCSQHSHGSLSAVAGPPGW
ncbi:hypothetical protein AN478_13410 [Thiohalorhabdus denitrificans]|nr:hypothetical protein AN478_13410 [Thiohalorhabdus denitrificans]